jgi:hypothetical protein
VVNRIIFYNTKYSKIFVSLLLVLLVTTAPISVYAFSIVKQVEIVPTQDLEAANLISGYGNESVLTFYYGMIYYYNISSELYPNRFYGLTYWEEQNLPPDERLVEKKPKIKYTIFTKKYADLNMDWQQIEKNLNNDTTMIRFYDNGFAHIYT